MIAYYEHSDLLNGFEDNIFDAILHGCNCFHTMGAGIAGAIAKKYPIALEEDKKTNYGDWEKLGTYSKCSTVYGDIINGYTQYKPGKEQKNYLYENIKKLFTKINIDYKGKTIGIPKIGSGIAGGNWEVIAKIIQQTTPDVKIIVMYI